MAEELQELTKKLLRITRRVVSRGEINSQRRQSPLPTDNLNPAIARQINLARCLNGAYAVARWEPEAAEWWGKIGYESFPWRNLFTLNASHNPEDETIPTAEEITCEEKQKYFHVLRRIEQTNEENPLWIVACRGTILHHMHDWKEDLKIWSGDVKKSPSYNLLLKIVVKLCKLHGAGNVCVTGHSLGGGYGLLVWRTLALEKKYLATYHLFNPPHGNLRVMVQYIYRSWQSVIKLPKKAEKKICSFLKQMDNCCRSSEAEKLGIVTSREALQLLYMYINTSDVISEGYDRCVEKLGKDIFFQASERGEKEDRSEENEEEDEGREMIENTVGKEEGKATLHIALKPKYPLSISHPEKWVKEGFAAHYLQAWLENIVVFRKPIDFESIDCIYKL